MNDRTAYLSYLLAWGAPVIVAQAVGIGAFYRAQAIDVYRSIGPPVLAVTAWLAAIDHFAILDGVWIFGEGRTLGQNIGAVPIEEILFFLFTNLLVAQGLALLGRRRFQAQFFRATATTSIKS